MTTQGTHCEEELRIEDIAAALENSLSTNQVARDKANQYLLKQCEQNPQFQVLLLHLIRTAGTPPAASANTHPSPEQIQLQYQAILCLKNSLTRLLQMNRGRGFASRVIEQNRHPGVSGKQVSFSGLVQSQRRQVISEELRNQIKQELLEMIVQPDNVILSKYSYDQLTFVATIFVKYDFPANWQAMNLWLLKTLEQLQQCANMYDVNMLRFLGFYHEVLKEQSKKQLTNTKSQFIKVAKDHMKAIARLWAFYNEQQTKMIWDVNTSTVNFANFNPDIFAIANKLDKILLLIVKCGFSVNNLLTQPENNWYVETMGQLIGKLKLFTECTEQVSQMAESNEKLKFMEIFIGQVKTFLKRLSELQSSENLLMFDTIDKYLLILAQLLFRSELYPIRVNKLTMIAILKVVNTDVYKATREVQGHLDGIGMIVSPVKFKNLEPQIEVARQLFRQVMDEPIPDGEPADRNKQDGAKQITQLVTYKFLSQIDLSSWQRDPEYFLENEDEQFMFEYDLQDDSSLNLLAQHLVEKLLQKFYPIVYPYVQSMLDAYFKGQLANLSVKEEDALLNLAGIIGKVQRDHKVKLDKRLDVRYVFQFIKENKWQGNEETFIFKRRFLLILTHWVKIMPKTIFFDQFKTVCDSLSQIGAVVNAETGEMQLSALEKVLVYEHCHCIHEMIKEILGWLRIDEQRKNHGTSAMPGELPKDIEELRGSSRPAFTDSEEDNILFSKQINAEINYAKLCQLICSKLIPLLEAFNQPNLIWTMINFLSLILEQTVSQAHAIEECFRYFTIFRILQTDTETHIYEAILDLLKNLLIICPSSPVVLNLCCDLLDFKLSQSLNDGNTVAFWLYTMRAVDDKNAALPKLKSVFLKFSGCLTGEALSTAQTMPLVAVQSIKRDYIYNEFLQVAHEGVLLNLFNHQEIGQLIQFAGFKFSSELQADQSTAQNQIGNNSDYNSSDDGGNIDEGTFQKKANLVLLQQIIYNRLEKEHGDEILNSQKQFMLECCCYLIDARGSISPPNSNVLFQQIVSYVSRLIVIKQADFVNAVLLGELASKGYTLDAFIEALINKMDNMVSWEEQRLKTLTLLTLLPLLTAEIVQSQFAAICKHILNRLEYDLYLKLANEKELSTYSPNRFKMGSAQDMSKRPNAVKIRTHEKHSQRHLSMKREDWLLEFDQIDIFWQKIRELLTKFNMQSIDPLVEILPEEMKQSFVNLVNGHSPRYEQRKKDEAQLPQSQENSQQQQIVTGGSLLQQYSANALYEKAPV